MTSERLTYEDFVFISKFLGDYLLFKRGGVQDEERLNTAVFIEQMIQSWSPSRIREKLENDPTFVNQVRRMFFLSFQFYLQQVADPFTSATVRSYSKSNASRFEDYSDYFWLKWAGSDKEAGETGLVLGLKGSGKTDFCLMMGEKAEKQGWVVISNILTYGRFEYFTTFSEMLRLIIQNARLGLKTLCIIDEMTVAGMRRQRSQGSESLNLEELQRLTRKFGTSMLLIWHLDRDVTTEMKQTASLIVNKHGSVQSPKGRRTANVSFRITGKSEEHLISGIPSTGIKYDTNDVAPFVMDIKLRDILKEVVENEGSENLYDAILEFLNKRIDGSNEEDLIHESN